MLGATTIHQQVTNVQGGKDGQAAQSAHWKYELERFHNTVVDTVNGVMFYADGSILCPLCDRRHVNAAVCQMDLGE